MKNFTYNKQVIIIFLFILKVLELNHMLFQIHLVAHNYNDYEFLWYYKMFQCIQIQEYKKFKK